MMNLLKYDWKRNATTLLGALAVLLIIQVAINWGGSLWGWGMVTRFGLSMMAYVTASVLLLVVACKTFDFNIKAYHRRLVPVRSVWTVVSVLLLSCITTFLLSCFALLHFWFFRNVTGVEWNELILPESWLFHAVTGAILIAWKFIFLMLTIFFAITVSRSLARKGSIWIGILAFFLLHYVLGLLSHMIFGEGSDWIGSISTVPMESGIDFHVTQGQYLLGWGSIAFEVVMAALILYTMVYLIDRKVEV
ncbi:hypothetical protein JCM10914A_14480 [Paenibacillus sp. JCM 10914]|uniref:hypothetical protein n=1 Tax=Paenibacillus sp. JCM 10914 TaxID=1236974 RepID=UPI0003CC4823|nr:hypothetical protein [Paenibacillus sp. JCM 10914]GAE08796.1 hypothetical protein JCM10914_5130 [Paenibacillus sp. JCM 10914]